MTAPHPDFLDLERTFWLAGPDHYAAHLAPDATMIFAGTVGLLTREQILQSIASAPRWASVDLESPRITHLAPTCALLTYRATARRPAAAPYHALASSVYTWSTSGWQLAFHQQTPIHP
jgi:hypothetical protein